MVMAAADEQISRIDHEEFTGSSVVEYLAKEAGWIITSVKRLGRNFGYMLCPQCVEQDFARLTGP